MRNWIDHHEHGAIIFDDVISAEYLSDGSVAIFVVGLTTWVDPIELLGYNAKMFQAWMALQDYVREGDNQYFLPKHPGYEEIKERKGQGFEFGGARRIFYPASVTTIPSRSFSGRLFVDGLSAKTGAHGGIQGDLLFRPMSSELLHREQYLGTWSRVPRKQYDVDAFGVTSKYSSKPENFIAIFDCGIASNVCVRDSSGALVLVATFTA